MTIDVFRIAEIEFKPSSCSHGTDWAAGKTTVFILQEDTPAVPEVGTPAAFLSLCNTT